MTDLLKANDAILRGQARAQAAFRKFQQKWTEPMMIQFLRVAWAQMAPEQKEELKRVNPQRYEQIARFFEVTEGG